MCFYLQWDYFITGPDILGFGNFLNFNLVGGKGVITATFVTNMEVTFLLMTSGDKLCTPVTEL